MPLSNLRVEHNLNGNILSEDELRQATYALNQQREGRQPRPPGGMQPMPSMGRNEKSKPPVVDTEGTPSIDTSDSDKLLKANKSDLKKRNIK